MLYTIWQDLIRRVENVRVISFCGHFHLYSSRGNAEQDHFEILSVSGVVRSSHPLHLILAFCCCLLIICRRVGAFNRFVDTVSCGRFFRLWDFFLILFGWALSLVKVWNRSDLKVDFEAQRDTATEMQQLPSTRL